MEYLRKNKRLLIRNEKNLKIQLSDWSSSNVETGEEDTTFNIKAFGITKNGSSVSVNITGFEPHFYVLLDNNDIDEETMVDNIRSEMRYKLKSHLIDYETVEKKLFWGFTNNNLETLVKLSFQSSTAMNDAQRKCETLGYKVYESNIPPMLRFFHIRNIEPCNWIVLKKGTYELIKDEYNTQYSCEVHWEDVCVPKKPIVDIAPFYIASFDIECDSSHGDFPLPSKDYKKLAQDIAELYYKKNWAVLDYKTLSNQMTTLINDAYYQTEKKVSKVYIQPGMKPPETSVINFVGQQFAKVLKMSESYKILVADIITFGCAEYNFITKTIDKKKIIKYLYYAFRDDDLEEKINELVDLPKIFQIYTKSSLKPSVPAIEKAASNIQSLFMKYFKKQHRTIYNHYNKFYFLNKDEMPEKYKLEFSKEGLSNVSMLANQIMTCFTDFPEITSSKEIKVKRLNNITTLYDLPMLEGDKVIQIGTVVQKFGETEPFLKHIITLDTCEALPGIVVESYDTEEEVILAWSNFITKLDPDIITGYNIFGFDYMFLWERAKSLGIEEEFGCMSRIKNKSCELKCQKLASSALGDNNLSYMDLTGRVNMDLLKIVQRDHRLESYKLDFVAETFMNDKVLAVKDDTITIKGINVLNKGNFITLSHKGDKICDEAKFKILEIDYTTGLIQLDTIIKEEVDTWQLAKDDVSPKDIFRLQKTDAKGRGIVANYCIQDCALVLHLIRKLQIITNNIAMANTCSVPLSFIFLRGQGIKVFSLISKECMYENYVIPVIKYEQDVKTFKGAPKTFEPSLEYEDKPVLPDSYEGAIVLPPKPGIYLDKYVTVLDYSSLYPSSMISENLSHDSLCLDKKYHGEEGGKLLKKMGYDYVDITHDVYKWKDPKIRTKGKYKAGQKTCRFVQLPNNEKSIVPSILQKLLRKRKETRAKIKTETDEFKKGVLDGQQLSFKLTANSVYGAIGATTNPICMKDIAASTTAVGRSLLHLAQEKTLEKFDGAEIVYGDTDSIFINFNPKDDKGNKLTGKEGLKKSIDLGCQAEEYIQKFLKKPHKLEYEKTFYPFILFSKKRYIGYKYEFDLEKYKETSMGIVTKRRDNAKIVKFVYKRVMDSLLKHKDLELSLKTLNQDLMDLINGKFNLKMLTITKSLRGFYANPESIAHKVLADRIGEREPGNQPKSNDRIPYVYIEIPEQKDTKILQGDRVEHPDFIKANQLKPDYNFYITNQILKPVGQIYTLIVETLPGFTKGSDYFDTRYKYFISKYDGNEKKAYDKITDEKLDIVKKIVFGEVLRCGMNKKNKAREITDFFKIKPN